MRIGRRRAQRIGSAAQDAYEITGELYPALVNSEISEFKLDKLQKALEDLINISESRDRERIRLAGINAFYRYVLFQGYVITGEADQLNIVDSLEEVVDLLNLITAL